MNRFAKRRALERAKAQAEQAILMALQLSDRPALLTACRESARARRELARLKGAA